jgi:Ca-activated chloride channel homolog
MLESIKTAFFYFCGMILTIMSLLTPLALLLGLLAVPVILMYMLRLRRQEVLVSSTLLWQKLLRDREANAPWQKLRRNWLLILQLLILAALVFALARPFLPVPSLVSGNVVVLLDASASMQATDVDPSRFEAARAEVHQLINNLSGSDQMTLIKVGQTATVLAAATNDRGQLRQALDAARPEPAGADWPAAFALAAGAAQGYQDAQILILSDGGLPSDLPPLPVTAVYQPIGSSGENLAISALATRDSDEGPQLFAGVYNAGQLERQVLLAIRLDGALFDSRRLTVPAGETAVSTWDLPAETVVIQANLSDNEGDYLPLDDVAWAVHEGEGTNRTLLVTEGNLFLEQVFGILPGLNAFKVAPDSPILTDPTAEDQFDLYVFDGVPLPDPLPDGDLFIINPQPGAELYSSSGPFTNTAAIRITESSLLQFVDWRSINIRQAQAVSAPWGQTVIQADGGPLLLTGERDGRRIALLTFDVRDSDLPLQIAFPILMANITDWLNPGHAFDTMTGIQPGDPVTILPGAGTMAVMVTKPDGSQWRSEVGETAVLFNETIQPGIYQVTLQESSGSRPAGRFAVNLFNTAEANIAPAASLQLGQASVEAATEGNIGQREFWPWLIGLALLFLTAEWWVHHRPSLNLGRKWRNTN